MSRSTRVLAAAFAVAVAVGAGFAHFEPLQAG